MGWRVGWPSGSHRPARLHEQAKFHWKQRARRRMAALCRHGGCGGPARAPAAPAAGEGRYRGAGQPVIGKRGQLQPATGRRGDAGARLQGQAWRACRGTAWPPRGQRCRSRRRPQRDVRRQGGQGHHLYAWRIRCGAPAAAAGLRPDPPKPEGAAGLFGHHRAAQCDPGQDRPGYLPRADRLRQLECVQCRPVPARPAQPRTGGVPQQGGGGRRTGAAPQPHRHHHRRQGAWRTGGRQPDRADGARRFRVPARLQRQDPVPGGRVGSAVPGGPHVQHPQADGRAGQGGGGHLRRMHRLQTGRRLWFADP